MWMALNTFKCNCLTPQRFKGLNLNLRAHCSLQITAAWNSTVQSHPTLCDSQLVCELSVNSRFANHTFYCIVNIRHNFDIAPLLGWGKFLDGHVKTNSKQVCYWNYLCRYKRRTNSRVCGWLRLLMTLQCVSVVFVTFLLSPLIYWHSSLTDRKACEVARWSSG